MVETKNSDIQSGYDQIADEYARRIYDELLHKPFDRDLLDRFAESVRNDGITCDLGCGPGHVARYLQERGVPVCGIDLSQGMLERARQLNPGIEFRQGDMRSLLVEDNTWAGITAFYSIVNLPADDVAKAVCEMARVLSPGGRLLVAFHAGEDTVHLEENLWDTGVALETTFFRPERIAGYMRSAGLEMDEIVERGPYAPEVEYQSRRAYIFGHKPTTKTTSA